MAAPSIPKFGTHDYIAFQGYKLAGQPNVIKQNLNPETPDFDRIARWLRDSVVEDIRAGDVLKSARPRRREATPGSLERPRRRRSREARSSTQSMVGGTASGPVREDARSGAPEAVRARPRATPKDQLPTKLDGAIAPKSPGSWVPNNCGPGHGAVKDRDLWKDRKTGVWVTVLGNPIRCARQRITSIPATIRPCATTSGMGWCLSFANHKEVTHHRLRIEGTFWFRKGGARYTEVTYHVLFVRT